MALTKLTKHIVSGATIVQVRYKDCSNLSTGATGATQWDSMTLTPQYADSILEVRFQGICRQAMEGTGGNNDHSNNVEGNLHMYINGSNEYTINDAFSFADFGQPYGNSSTSNKGKAVNMFHRHLPGSTNLQTISMQITRSSNDGGSVTCQNGFLIAKEIAGGVLLGTPGNAKVN